jgi:hypothetical protein
MADRPDTVYIVRHGEKLGDPSNEKEGGPDLSIRGSSRAAAIPSLFAPASPELSCKLAGEKSGFGAQYLPHSESGPQPPFQRPHFLFATRKSGTSDRPIETITPLSAALGLTINAGGKQHEFSDEHYEKLAKLLLDDSTYAGKVVLICWHHGKIPDLAGALGVVNPPTPWNPAVFDRVWEIAYDTDPPTLHDHPQQLLFGDAAT